MLLWWMMACKMSSQDFSEKSAKVACDRLEECDGGAFTDAYDDQADCQTQTQAFNDNAFDEYQKELNCTFDSKKARECLHLVRSASCDEWSKGDFNETCAAVWQCPSAT